MCACLIGHPVEGSLTVNTHLRLLRQCWCSTTFLWNWKFFWTKQLNYSSETIDTNLSTNMNLYINSRLVTNLTSVSLPYQSNFQIAYNEYEEKQFLWLFLRLPWSGNEPGILFEFSLNPLAPKTTWRLSHPGYNWRFPVVFNSAYWSTSFPLTSAKWVCSTIKLLHCPLCSCR